VRAHPSVWHAEASAHEARTAFARSQLPPADGDQVRTPRCH
jgi:hypothetical protein